jgi:uncharacterized integral membrane protein
LHRLNALPRTKLMVRDLSLPQSLELVWDTREHAWSKKKIDLAEFCRTTQETKQQAQTDLVLGGGGLASEVYWFYALWAWIIAVWMVANWTTTQLPWFHFGNLSCKPTFWVIMGFQLLGALVGAGSHQGFLSHLWPGQDSTPLGPSHSN